MLRRFVAPAFLALPFLALTMAGCQPMPPMSTDYGAGYAPCAYQAVDNGMCPYVGYKRPLPSRQANR